MVRVSDEYQRHTEQPSAEASRAAQQYDQGHRDHYYDDHASQQQRRQQPRRTKLKKNNNNTLNEGKIKRGAQRDNMTFSGNQCRDIDRGNIALLSRLSNIHNRGGGGVPRAAPTKSVGKKKKGSASINMRRKQDKIAEENRKFAMRLQRVRGTGSLSKKSLRKHAQRTAKFADLGREVRPVLSKRQKQRKQREQRESRESGWQ